MALTAHSILSSRWLLFLGLGLFFGSLQWAYPTVMVPAFSYCGMTLREQSLPDLFIQFGFACLPFLWLPRDISKPSHFQLWLLHLTVVAPSCIVPYHISLLPRIQLHIITASLVACFWLLSLSPRIPPLRSPLKTDSPTLLYATLLVFTIATYSWLLFSTGTSTLFLDIEDVYSTRADIRANPYHPVLNYMYWWQGSTVNPMVMALGFATRRPLLVIIGGLLQIELYSLTSLRGFLAGSVFTCGMGFFLLAFKHGRGVVLSWAITACVILAVIWYAFDQHAIAALLLLDRWIFNGGQISGCYFEFFSTHEPAHLQHSSIAILRWLFPGSYDLPIGQIIGRAYFIEFADGEYTNATGHFWADGFASFGYLGMVVATGVGVLYMWIIDSLSHRKNHILVLTSFSMVGLSLTGQSVLTSILTGGIAPYILLLVLVPESRPQSLPDTPRGRLWPA